MNSNEENSGGAPLIGSTIDSLFLPVYDATDDRVDHLESTSSSSSSAIPIDTFMPPAATINNPVTINENDDNEPISKLSQAIYGDLLEDVTFGLILQMHRAAKLDYITYVDVDNEVDAEFEKQYQMYTDSDVLGVFSSLNETFKATSNKFI
jgi:hypothetical protein